MSNFIRTAIFEKFAKTFQHVTSENQQNIMTSLGVRFYDLGRKYSFFLSLKSIYHNITNVCKNDLKTNLKEPFDDVVINDSGIHLSIERDKYVKRVVENNRFGVIPPMLVENKKNVVIEFSSPNIAKPFHFGHLRSTVIGNYVANINSFLQHNVTRINYLGDWGTQVGYILLGMKMTNIYDSCLGKNDVNVLKQLYNAYVEANRAAENEPLIHEEAKIIFQKLEAGEPTITKKWNEIKDLTTLSLKNTYNRIGITFDEYDWESMYNYASLDELMKSMEDMQLLKLDNVNRKVIHVENTAIPLTRNNNTSLYMFRDIAAAIDRFERKKFDVMYYVVDYSQANHFSNLFNILHEMKLPWAKQLVHIKFGRVQGMSTRAGTAVFLEDILNEAQRVMQERQKKRSTTTVINDELDKSSDILAVSNVIIYNLKQHRLNSYVFDYSLAFDAEANLGVKFQYTHCRLCRLEETFASSIPTECDPNALTEPEVDDLILVISQFDEAVLKSYKSAESYILVIYLSKLCSAINKAFRILKIKDADYDLRNQRLLLFYVARLVLAQGMKLLGLQPLRRM